MFLHYLKIAWRNIWNDKFYSLINLVGLTVAFTVVFLFVQWIRFELSFENCYPDADRIYQVQEAEKRDEGIYKKVNQRTSINEAFKKTYPTVESAISIYQERLSLKVEDKEPVMVYLTSTQEDFFKLFPMKVVAGNIKDTGLIISEELAIRIFGEPIKAIGANATFFKDLQPISAVLRVPENSMIRVEAMSIAKEGQGFDFGGVEYILLRENVQFTTELQHQMAQFLSQNKGSENKLIFQPLKKVHLHTDSRTERISNKNIHYGSIREIHTFIWVVFLLLALAVINYINTSIARAMSRAKEVGVRKIGGSTQGQLIVRFLIESLIISLIATLLAVDIAKLLHHPFESIMGNTFPFRFDGYILMMAVLLCLFTGVLAAGYASFYLSSLNPVQVLSGRMGKIGSKDMFRKVLLGFQFTIAIGILICTWTVFRQLHYMLNKDLGFNKEDIYMFDTSLMYNSEDFIAELLKSPYIINATMAGGAPYNVTWGYGNVSWEGAPDGTREMTFTQLSCDHRFAETFGLQMVQGEFIPPGLSWWQDATDKSYNVVINETFKALMGRDNPLGMKITYGDSWQIEGTVIGVIKDFYFRPMNYKLSPLIMAFNPETTGVMYIKIDPKYEKEALQHIRSTYDTMRKDVTLLSLRPFILKPLEDEYKEMYRSETRLQQILGIFSLLSVILSFMGIVSMIAFIIEKRTKEIAIRKINGATWFDIIREFWREFLLLLGIASVPAVLVSYWFMQEWLQQYVYRPVFGWWVFIGVPLLVAVITIFILFLQVRTIARRNPVESLRSE